jgi:hypothetical protein
MIAYIIALLSMAYVMGGYQMIPDSLPYLRDVIDLCIGGMFVTSILLILKDFVLGAARLVTKVASDNDKQEV